MLTSNDCILLALGSNLASLSGSPATTLRAALSGLEEMGASIRAVSPFYSTPAFPAGNGPDYVNAAARISANWTAEEALSRCHEIEAELGRERLQRWGQRTLDIDLIAMADTVLPDAQTHATWRELPLEDQQRLTPQELILPHPRVQDRAFVLVPLSDIAPDWIHPVLGQTVLQMLENLDPKDLAEVRRLE